MFYEDWLSLHNGPIIDFLLTQQLHHYASCITFIISLLVSLLMFEFTYINKPLSTRVGIADAMFFVFHKNIFPWLIVCDYPSVTVIFARASFSGIDRVIYLII